MLSQRYQISAREVDDAADYLLGRPYERDARGPINFDCFGLLVALYRRCGIELDDPFKGHGTMEEYAEFQRQFRRVEGDEETQPLDVLKQRRPESHVSVVLTGGYALDTAVGVSSQRVRARELDRFVTGIWRLQHLAVS